LNGPDATVCTCGGPVIPCAAPRTLRGVYRLDKRIGAGGMGVVYLARDLNLDRPVAIKTLPAVSP
jgi:serine/threonine-protein kinase